MVFEGSEEDGIIDGPLLAAIMSILLVLWIAVVVAIGVLPGGLLAASHVNNVDTESCFDAVVVPMKSAALFGTMVNFRYCLFSG